MHVQVNIQDKEYHCPTLEFTHRVKLVSNMMEDVWQDSPLPEGRTIRVLFHACAVLKPILSLGCYAATVLQ